MKEYKIKMLPAIPDSFEDVERAEISEYRWVSGYEPRAYAQVVFVEGKGFLARLTCEEKNPKAVATGFFSDVYKDSCMEFFASFDSDKPDYLNIEMNSVGASLVAVGPDRYSRKRIDKVLHRILPVKATVSEKEWRVEVFISLRDIRRIFHLRPAVFREGYAFRGNFFKCGDETDAPHYGMWSPSLTEKPDFHQPSYFGRLILSKE